MALLRASGYTATLMHVAPPADAWTGGFRIPLGGTANGYDAAAWLGCATGTVSETWSSVGGLLRSAGLKAYCGGSGSSPAGYDVRLEHYWAGIVLDGYLYPLDPCFKPRLTTPHRDILADAGYSRSSLLATAGGSIGSSHVQGLSAAALGLATTFAYDDRDRLILTTFPDGSALSGTWTAAGLRASETLLDAAGRTLRHTTFAYDGGGRPATQTTQGRGLPSPVTTATAFDTAGNLVRAEDANGHVTRFRYDARGLLTNTTDAAGHTVRRTYGPRGMPAAVTDPLGRTTSLLWTPSGEPAAVQLPDGSLTTNTYDAVDRLASFADTRGTCVSLDRDAAGRITRRHTPRWEERTWYDTTGCATSVLNAAAVRTDYGYDWLDRPVLAVDGLDRGWWTAYDALDRVTATTDPRGRSRHYTHDALGRRTAAIRPSGAVDSFGYDGLGNWTTHTNAEGRVYTMSYDALSRPLAATNALGQQVFLNAYDPAGNLTNRADGAGNTVRYAYDALDRLVARDAFSQEGHEKHETFAYDAVGNLLTASNEMARLSFTYDVMDRLATATTVLSNATFTAAYARDAGGLVTNLVYAPGKIVARTYDADGRLVSLSDWLGHTWHFAWDGAGKPTGGTSPGGIAATNRYDAAGRLASWSVGTLAGRTVTRDAAGLKTREDVTAGPHPAPVFVRYATNTFDAADRLVSAQVYYGSHTNAPVSETYHYDGNGALTSLVSGGESVFTASYSPLGQISSLFLPFVPFVVECTYDPLGNRLISGDRLFIPDHADPLKRPLMECDLSGNVLRYYLWAPGRLLGFIDAASGTLTVAHRDEYGSVIALTDASGNTLHTACYGPNGQDWGTTGANPTPFAWLGGHGVQQVAVSGHLGPLYLTRHRLYSASLQRFLSPDPLGLAGGLNLYAYAEGDPLSYIDPLGLCSENNYWETGSYLGDVGQFFLGYGDAIADTVGGLYNVVRHPIQTAAGLFNAVAHPVQTAQAMADGIAETWNSGNRGRGRVAGNAFIIAATIAAPHAKASGTSAVAAPKTVASVADDAATAIGRSPNFIAAADGSVFPVPQGATGPLATRAPGMQFIGGSGGHGLDARVMGVRFMDANAKQGARAVYMNQAGQTVNPYTGRTVPYSDPTAHFYFNPNP